MRDALWESGGSGGNESCGFLLVFGDKFIFTDVVLRGNNQGRSPCLGSVASGSRCVCMCDVLYGRDEVTGLD